MAVFLLLLPPIYNCWLHAGIKKWELCTASPALPEVCPFPDYILVTDFLKSGVSCFFPLPNPSCMSRMRLCVFLLETPLRDVSVDRWFHFISFSTCKVNVLHRKTLTTIYSVMQTEILPHSCSSGKTRSNYILRTFLRSFLSFFRVDQKQLLKLRTQEHIWYFPLKVTNGLACPGLSSRVST